MNAIGDTQRGSSGNRVFKSSEVGHRNRPRADADSRTESPKIVFPPNLHFGTKGRDESG